MPPKPKFTKDEIISAALQIVAEGGKEALTARELGHRLGSSTRPIFTLFRGMEELQVEVRAAAMRIFENSRPPLAADMPPFKQIGIQMVQFGKKEPKLFQLLFMKENDPPLAFDAFLSLLGPTAADCIAILKEEHDLNDEQAAALFENEWIYTFGLGALCATGACTFSDEELGRLLSFSFNATLARIKAFESERKSQAERAAPSNNETK